jgi:hypothetical protein
MVKVNLIKAPADFNDLLDLQDLKTQMSVLDHLKSNLRKYQMDFIRSFIKTSDEVIKCIPPEDIGEYEIFNCYDYDFTYPEHIKKFRESAKNWVVNHKDKRMMEIDDLAGLKFKMKDNILIASDKRTIKINTQVYYRATYFDELKKDIRMSFRFDTNELIDCSDYSYMDKGQVKKW